ncbi:NUDIX hydrolase domain-like protein [Pavlovales sp. CCMP2436]|nr:NUDIX hydrolase domain-like protein [Pavlovales sp. CCMP2436]
MADGPLAGLDPEQVRMMEERIIVVDRGDRILRPESKVNAHLNEHGPMLHRAFSVFIFDDEGRLLLQQRAPEKVTFPSCWTNTCCSHPLYTPDELGEGDGGFLDGAVTGCARAAIRKLEHELGIRTNTFAPEDLLFLTRIHYLARAAADSPDERVEFGEHEIDYLFVARVPAGGMLMVPNANEVSATRFVDEAGMRKMLAQARKGELRLTPWFEMIAEEFLFRWWTDLHDRPKLLAHRDVDSIFRFGECAAEPMQVEPPESNSVVS